MVYDLVLYGVAALGEIFGCYAFWMGLRANGSGWWLLVGLVALIIFAVALAKIDVAFASKAYLVYGGIYIVASLGWMMVVDQVFPTRWDLIGVVLCLCGVMVMFFQPRGV